MKKKQNDIEIYITYKVMRKGAKKKVTHNIGLYLGEQRLVKEGTVTSISGLFIYLFI